MVITDDHLVVREVLLEAGRASDAIRAIRSAVALDPENEEYADLLGQAQVNPSGDRVVLRLALTDDQMTSLIKKNTFALKM